MSRHSHMGAVMSITHLPTAYRPNTAWQYRVRLLQAPVMLYNGRSFEYAVMVMDRTTSDRILERRELDGWRTVISVEGGES